MVLAGIHTTTRNVAVRVFLRAAACLLFGAEALSPVFAQQRSVAVTFDDLPVAGSSDSAEARSINDSILKSLKKNHVPAIGFVIENRVQEIGASQGREILNRWVAEGNDLGNHTFSHTSFNELTVEQFEQEIVKGEHSFAAALAKAGKHPRYFRFPMNNAGGTREKHDAIANFLASRGYRLAPCTIDNEDYVFDARYRQILANKDDAAASKLRSDYLAYTATEIDYYSAVHKQIFGHEIPHVMLLHANRLNADVIDSVLRLFADRKYRFVSLGEALSDPEYATPDTLVTEFGWMWAYRWAKELGVKVNGSLETEPPAWVLEYGKQPKNK